MEILEVTVENFDEKVLNSEKPVMLDFWAKQQCKITQKNCEYKVKCDCCRQNIRQKYTDKHILNCAMCRSICQK